MSVSWDQIQALPVNVQQKIQSLFTPLFPVEARAALSDCLLSINSINKWTDLNLDYDLHRDYLTSSVLPAIVSELRDKAAGPAPDTGIPSVALFTMERALSDDAVHLARLVRQSLSDEAQVIADHENGVLLPAMQATSSLPVQVPQAADLFDSLKRLRDLLQQSLPQMKQENEHLFQDYSTYRQKQESWNSITTTNKNNLTNGTRSQVEKEKAEWEAYLRQKAESVSRNRSVWLQTLESCTSVMQELMSQVLDRELEAWKRKQQVEGNGGPAATEQELDRVQERSELLAETLWMHVKQLQSFDNLCTAVPLTRVPDQRLAQLRSRVHAQLNRLIQRTFLVERQPPQVMRTNTRFPAKVRFLVGVPLNVHMSSPDVTVSIINEENVQVLLDSGGQKVVTSGDIMSGREQLEREGRDGPLTASFKHLQLKKVKHEKKKNSDCVMDDKFCLLFRSTFRIANGELTFTVHTLSLPVVVVVHGIQESRAMATVTWDNAFAVPGRLPFQVPDSVTWSEVADLLNTKFRSCVGCDLGPDALSYLAEKAFRNPRHADYHPLRISWSQFAKDNLPNKSFSFWDWFYAQLKLTKDHMRDLWQHGCVSGFVPRRQAEQNLLSCDLGTFLLRFSDSELGGITVAWVGENKAGLKEVFMLQPFTAKDFVIRRLADRIHDLPDLLFLFPGTPKDLILSQFYSVPDDKEDRLNGYVKHELALTLSGSNKRTSLSSGPSSLSPTSPIDVSAFQMEAGESSLCHEMNSVSVGPNARDLLSSVVESEGLMDFDINELADMLEPRQ